MGFVLVLIQTHKYCRLGYRLGIFLLFGQLKCQTQSFVFKNFFGEGGLFFVDFLVQLLSGITGALRRYEEPLRFYCNESSQGMD